MLTALLAVVLSAAQPAHTYAQADKDRLRRVEKIYIDSDLEANGERTFLGKELERRGFAVVDDSAGADAVLSRRVYGSFATNDEGMSEPDKIIYFYWLWSSDKQVIWKGKFSFRGKSDMTENGEHAAKLLAEKLFKEREKSSKKARAKQRTAPDD